MPRAPKLGERDLDDEFEKFLKESLSDDSMDFTSKRGRGVSGGSKAKEKDDDTPWWMKDDDDSALKTGRGRKKSAEPAAPVAASSSMKWLKPKKQSTPLKEVEEVADEEEEDTPAKPTRKAGKSEGDQKVSTRLAERRDSQDSLEDEKLDLKKQDSRARSGVIPEQASFEDTYSQSEPSGSLSTPASTTTSRDPLGSFATPGSTGGHDPLGALTTPGSTGPGAETLEEIADKARFFQELEAKAGGRGGAVLDYSRLNREADLSGTMGTMGTLPSAYMGSPDATGLQMKKDEEGDKPRQHESEDAVDAMLRPSPPSQKDPQGGAGMLGNVDLLDTMDTAPSPAKPLVGGKGDAESTSKGGFLHPGMGTADTRGLSTGGTTGELEALQAILREAANTPTMHLTDDFDQSYTAGVQPRTVEDILREANEERILNRGESQNIDPISGAIDEDSRPKAVDLQTSQEHGLLPREGSRQFGSEEEEEEEARGFALSPAAEARNFRGNDLQYPSAMDLQPASGGDIESLEAAPKHPSPACKPQVRKKSPPRQRGRYSHIRSSGYGKSKSGSKATWSPAEVGKQRVKGSEVPALNGRDDKSQRHLLASVESFASYLQDQFADGKRITPPPKQSVDEPILSASMRESRLHSFSRERALVAEVNEWQEQWQEERRLNAKMRAEIVDHQREFAHKEEELRIAHEKELFTVKQENYVLIAKLNSQDDQDKARRRELVSGKTPEGVSQDEQLKLMQREIIQQETLLHGYQQENERLYSEVKKMQGSNRENEERMFKENQRLQTEVGNLRELMEMKDRALRNKGIITGPRMQQEIAAGNTAVLGAGKIAELQAQIKEHEIREASLRAEGKQLSQGKRELEEHIEQLVREKTRQQERLDAIRDGKQVEFKELQVKYQRDQEALQKKLRWYSENQDLLDRDAALLKEKDKQIAELKDQLRNGSSKANSKTAEAQRRAKERAADSKKIQDLERQVREMNDIIRKRNPNSLPALIYAANSTSSPLPAEVRGQRSSEGQPRSITFLEEKVKRLETELEGKEEENRRELRVVEQKYNAMKLRYEDRIATLESQLELAQETGRHAQSRPHTSLTALQKELAGVRERNRHQLDEAERENGELRRKLAKAVSMAASAGDGGGGGGEEGLKDRKSGGNEQYLQSKLSHLALELAAKDKELELLKSTVDKLMEERFHAWSASDSNKGGAGKGKKLKKATGGRGESGDDLDKKKKKPYVPENFAGSHISDVLMENEQLKQQLEDVTLEMEQQRVGLQASLAEVESATRQERERAAEEIAALRTRHSAEVSRLAAERVSSAGESKAARLHGQLETQQVVMRELEEQLREARLELDRLQGSRVRERVMETQLGQLQQELREARENHTPEMKHFEALQSKIIALENRHTQRERDLQLLVETAAQRASADKDQEIFSLQQLLVAKNSEIQRFRLELDAILEVLRELQRQGVVLPLHGQGFQSLL